jgi:hypothetical protein
MSENKLNAKEAAKLVGQIRTGSLVELQFSESAKRNVIGQLQAMVSEHNIKSSKELDELLHHIIWDGWEQACPDRTIEFKVGTHFDAKHFVKHVIRHVTNMTVTNK